MTDINKMTNEELAGALKEISESTARVPLTDKESDFLLEAASRLRAEKDEAGGMGNRAIAFIERMLEHGGIGFQWTEHVEEAREILSTATPAVSAPAMEALRRIAAGNDMVEATWIARDALSASRPVGRAMTEAERALVEECVRRHTDENKRRDFPTGLTEAVSAEREARGGGE